MKKALALTVIMGIIACLFCQLVEAEQAPAQEEALFEKKTERAFEQEKNADVVIYFENRDRILFEKPLIYTEEPLSLEEFEIMLDELDVKKELAVIIMSKAWSLESNEKKEETINKIERILESHGFQEIIIQQAHSMGRLILKENRLAMSSECKGHGEKPVWNDYNDIPKDIEKYFDLMDAQCCDGLVVRVQKEFFKSDCTESPYGGYAGICLACGDGYCDKKVENRCNCQEDCGNE